MNPEVSDGSRCLCGVEGWNHLLIQCSKCQLEYHRACVALSGTDHLPQPFVCPLCLLKEGKSYGPAEVRVLYHDHDPEENAKYVDVKACLDNYSLRVIRRALPPPDRKTITVELFLFIPGTNPNEKKPETRFESYSETPSQLTAQQCAQESSSSDEDFGADENFSADKNFGSDHAEFGSDDGDGGRGVLWLVEVGSRWCGWCGWNRGTP
ncbi:hypothetical protein FRC12_011371 [Ceratobasidium sp. 428]|nr:hypothetical protein FRC12_011371 [Ceratobasidium sp. 428]